MHLPGFAISAILAVRQAANLLPDTYCLPECPSCKVEFGDFNSSTACVANSSFITNCGSCQQCIIEFAVTSGEQESSNALEVFMVQMINMCADSPISAEVAGYQAQASRLSSLGTLLATLTATTTTTTAAATDASMVTAAPTAPETTTDDHANGHSWRCESATSGDSYCSSLLATATWASYFYARQSGGTLANKTATAVATHTPTPTPASSASPPPLNSTWIAGPVVGSILGVATVIVVIYCTRRRHAKSLSAATASAKEINLNDNDSMHSSQGGKAQLPAECVPVKELDGREIIPPVELPALEPVGSELSTPRDGKNPEEDWATLPMSPLRVMFVEAELRDQRKRLDEEPKHDTFYH